MWPSTKYRVALGVVFVCTMYLGVTRMQQSQWARPDGLVLQQDQGPSEMQIQDQGPSEMQIQGWNGVSNGPFITKATDTLGCSPHKQVPGITLHCSEGVDMKDSLSHKEKRANFYKVMLRKNAECSKPELLGKPGDGGWYACKVEPFLFKKPCLVYSFGIRDEWSFDDAVSKKYGCEVHSFDPSMGKEDHKHSELVYFHNTGLGGENGIRNVKGTDWKMRTLCTLVKELGHTQRTIDYLKFDVEFSEWDALVSMLDEGCLGNIKQLSLEAHAWGDTDSNYTLFWKGLHGLENFGFQKWRLLNRNWRCFKPKDAPQERRCPQTDMNFINANYMK